MRRRPELVRVVPARFPDQDREVREELERRQPPRVDLPGVDPGRQLAEPRLLPRTEQPAPRHEVRRLHVLRRHLPHAVQGTRGRHESVWTVDLVVRRLVAHLGDRGAELARMLADVHDRCVVELHEGVGEHLPIGATLDAELVAVGQPVERVVLDTEEHRAEELAQRLARLLGEVHEDEPREHVAVHGNQAVLGLVEVEELSLLLREGAGAVEPVAPPVVLAGELAGRSPRLLVRVVLPYELVAAVPAHVVERAYVVAVADHDDRGVRGGDVLGEEAPGAGKLLEAPDLKPRPPEDRVALQLVELGRDRVLVGDRLGAELGIVRRPAALGGLRVTSHRQSTSSAPVPTIRQPTGRYKIEPLTRRGARASHSRVRGCARSARGTPPLRSADRGSRGRRGRRSRRPTSAT